MLVVLAVAAALTAIASGRVTARGASQISPLDTTSPLVPSPTAMPTETPVATPTPEAPTVPGFLPAPTLTNPDDLRNNPPVIYWTPSASPMPTAEPSPTPLTLAGIVRSGIITLSYLWLCLGVVLMIGVGIAAIWLVRRAARS